MRLIPLALAAGAFLGCSSMTHRPDAQFHFKHRSPIAPAKPSISQRILQNRIEDAKGVSSRAEVEGAPTRK